MVWVKKRYMRDVQNQVTDITNETVDTDSKNNIDANDQKETNDK